MPPYNTCSKLSVGTMEVARLSPLSWMRRAVQTRSLSYPSAGTDDDGASRKRRRRRRRRLCFGKVGSSFSNEKWRIFWKKKRRAIRQLMRQRRQMRDARRRRRPSLSLSFSLSLSLSLSRARFRKERNKRASNSWYVLCLLPSRENLKKNFCL